MTEANNENINLEEEIETANNKLDPTLDEMEETEVDSNSLENKLIETREKYEDIFSQFQRLQADFANYKKRVEKEKSEIYLYANEKMASDLLNIIDNLERAIESQCTSGENNTLLEGINMIFKQLIETLAKHGIEEIEALGKPFDMNLHYAVMQEESDMDPDHVIEVLQKGYKINDKIIRPAMVKVSK